MEDDPGSRLRDEFGLLTAREVAAMLGTSLKRLQNKHSAGIGPPWIKVGQKVLYRRSSLEAWLAAQEKAHAAEPRL